MIDTKTTLKTQAKARFDARLTPNQKALFEKAARIKGKSLSEFIISVTQEAATVIIENHNAILASEKDRTLFFEAIINPKKPNKDLVKAAKDYQNLVASK